MKYFLVVFLAANVLAGCGNSDPEPTDESFDKEAMLENIGRNVILTSYDELAVKTEEMVKAKNDFLTNFSSENFSALREKYLEAHRLWQRCAPFEFGPAADRNLRLSVNTYPTDTAQILTNIADENYDLDIAQNSDAKGFPAIEYLLFISDDPAVFSEYARYYYLSENIEFIDDLVDATRDEWQGTYADEFAMNSGSSAGSSISFLINEMNFDFELVKNAKIGIPLGKKTLGITQPDKVEAPYSRSSLSLARANIEAFIATFNGASGKGIDDYLDHLDARHNSVLLSKAINDGFDEILDEIDAVSSDLVTAINDNPEEIEALYTALQNQVVLIKTDLPSQLGIQITYQDNDGD